MLSIVFLALLGLASAIPNPAAVNCEKAGLKYNHLKTNKGSYSVCETNDKRYVDAWGLFRAQRLKQGEAKLRFVSVNPQGELVEGEEVPIDQILRK